jgi:hypothetical protein
MVCPVAPVAALSATHCTTLATCWTAGFPVGADLSAMSANLLNTGMPRAAAVWTGPADTQLTRIVPELLSRLLAVVRLAVVSDWGRYLLQIGSTVHQ